MGVIFVPKETDAGETRVAVVPETIKHLQKLGLKVQVERGAGVGAGFKDPEYEAAGAVLVDSRARSAAELVVGIQMPTPEQASAQKSGSVLVCTLTPGTQLAAVQALRDAKVTAMGLEFMPRITRTQKMDILSSQATCSGYQAV